MIKKLWPGIVFILAAAAFGFAVSGQMPERVASHWDAAGEPNGYSSRIVLLLMVPVIGTLMSVVLAYAPQLDPKRRNFPLHAGAYWILTNTILIFLAAVHVLTIGYNIGWQVNFGRVMGIGLGLLFMMVGNFLTRVRPNWIMGIRTPWTLSSDRAWRETHRAGGYTFVVVGLVTLIAAFAAPKVVVFVLVGGVAFAALLSVGWSYFAWKRDPDAQGRDV